MEKIVKTGKVMANKEHAAKRAAPKGAGTKLNNQPLQAKPQESGDIFDKTLGLSAPDSVA